MNDLVVLFGSVLTLVFEIGFIEQLLSLIGSKVFDRFDLFICLDVGAVACRRRIEDKHEERQNEKNYQHIADPL